MDTKPEPDFNSCLENIIDTYEDRIKKIQSVYQASEIITESSYTLFESVRRSLNELKKERANLNSKLCEALAKNGSVRKKDYNKMMSNILDVLDQKEREAEIQFFDFIKAQKENAKLLKNSLLSFKDISNQDAVSRLRSVREQLSVISISGEKRKDMVLKSFLNFQNVHTQTMDYLKKILAKEGNITIKDIKHIKNQLYKDINIIGKNSIR